MELGTRLGPFELVARAGAGGMGEVYKARDSRLNRTVAVKVVKPGATTADRLRRFELEAQAASALSHPNILTIYDVGRDGDAVYLATEWVEGRTLREVIDGPALPMPRVVDLAHQVAEGLARAHAVGIVHRDIKPENVMVSDDGLVKIVDFGLAKLTAAADVAAGQLVTQSALTMAGLVMGTVGYMSPEQASGRALDHRSDQFSLGLLIYEMATRMRPFVRPTAAQSLAATIEAEPQPIDALNPDVSPSLAAIVTRCLAKDPADRYESTRDLARDLRQVLDAPPLRAAASESARRRSLGRRWWATAAVALAAVAAMVWLWWPARVAPRDPGRPLVAVRAFRNLSPDAAQSYFAAGMSEEIGGQLSLLSGLRLLSRAAVAQYGDGDIERLRRDLGVGSVVDGSVRVAGPRVRIAVQLIDASNQQTLWSGNYDRDLADVFAVQRDVALEVAHALQAALTPAERQRVDRRPTANLDAYQLYLRWTQTPSKGRGEWYANLGLLRQAIALDPAFVAARSSLAYSLILRSTFYDDGAAYLAEGMAEAEAVLKQDPTAARAHGALATGYAIKGVASRARLSFQRALTLDPNDTLGMNNLSMLEAYFGRFVEGLDWARRGFEGSGKLGNDYYHVSVPLISLRDDALSWRWLTEAEGRTADHARVQQQLALVEVLRGRDQDATARLARAAGREPGSLELTQTRSEVAFLIDSSEQAALVEPLIKESAGTMSVWVAETPRVRFAHALSKRGDATRAAALVDEAERSAMARIDDGDEMPVWRVELAAINALKKDRAASLDALARAYDAGYREYGYLERDPIFAPLRADERFRALLDRMRRDVETQRQAARERGLFDIDALLPRPR